MQKKKKKYGKMVGIGRIKTELKKSQGMKLNYYTTSTHTVIYKFIIYLFDYMLKWMQIKHDLWSFVQNYRIP